MQEFLAALKWVSGPFSLLAFIGLVMAFRRKLQYDHERQLIEAASDKQKADLVQVALDKFRLDYGNLTKDQKFQLYNREIQSREKGMLIRSLSSGFFGVLGTACFIVATVIVPRANESWSNKCTFVTEPPSYGERGVVPLGAEATLSLENTPPDATLEWSTPTRGSLNRQTGNNVIYRAKELGVESLKVTVTQGVYRFVKDVDFEVKPAMTPETETPSAPTPENALKPVFDFGTEYVVNNLETGLEYQFPTSSLTINNPHDQPLRIESLEFELQRFEVDRRAELVFQIMPFLDSVVVVISNVGWGPLTKGTLALLDPNAMTMGGDFPVQELLDPHPKQISLENLQDTAYLVFKAGPNGVPFGFSTISPIPLAMLKPPVLSVHENIIYTAPPRGRLVFMTRDNPAVPTKFSGVATFNGVMTDAGGMSCGVSYLAKELQAVPLSIEDVFLAEALNAKLRGSLLRDWAFTFGHALAKQAYQTLQKAAFGITVDFGKGAVRKIQKRVGIEIAPNESLKVDIQFRADQSAAFQTRATCSYRVGTGPQTGYAIDKTWDNKIRSPRTIDLGWEGTQAFAAGVSRSDTAIVERARSILRGTFPSFDLTSQTISQASHRGRQYADALWLLLQQSTEADSALTKTALLESASRLNAGLGENPQAFEWSTHVFPLLCERMPTEAAAAAGRMLATGDRMFISQFLSQTQAHPYLLAQSAAIQTHLNSLRDESNWGPTDIVLGAILRHQGLGETLAKKLSGSYIADPGLLAWAVVKLQNDRANSAITDRLRSPELTARDAEQLIEALTIVGENRFRNQIVEYAQVNQSKPTHATALMACLRHIKRFPGDDARSLLLELKDYRFRDEVREAAAELLNLPN